MKCGDYQYIWRAPDWPRWRFDLARLAGDLSATTYAQGILLGRLSDVGLALRTEASLAALTEDVVKTSEIEGERLDAASVRSSQVISGPVHRHCVQGTMDITDWLAWFLQTLLRAIINARQSLDTVLRKTRFWRRWGESPLNARQIKLLNRLLDGFEGNLTSRKWSAMAKCSPDTALRDITELLAMGVLAKLPGGGRNTAYVLNDHDDA